MQRIMTYMLFSCLLTLITYFCTLGKKSIVRQLATMLSTSKNVLFAVYNHLLTVSIDDPSPAGTQVIIKVQGHQHRWLAGGYDLEIGPFRSG